MNDNHRQLDIIIRQDCWVAGDYGEMTETQVNEIIDICTDCKCTCCTQVLPLFHVVLMSFKMGDIKIAAKNLSFACLKIQMYHDQMHAFSLN